MATLTATEIKAYVSALASVRYRCALGSLKGNGPRNIKYQPFRPGVQAYSINRSIETDVTAARKTRMSPGNINDTRSK